MVISMEAACVDNAILVDNLTSEVIGSIYPNIPIDNNCTHDELHLGMPVGSGDLGDEGDKSDAIPTASRWQRAATELERFDLQTSDVDRYEGEDADDADADEKEESSQANDGSTLNVEDWEYSRFDLETSDVEGYGCEDGDDADVGEEEQASQADDASMQNVEDWGHSTRECKD